MRAVEQITARQYNFVLEYCKDFNGTRAYIRAGYSEQGAESGASLLLSKPKVQAAIEERKEELAAVARLTPEWILKQWFDIASANPEEIVKLKVTCCADCYDSETCETLEAAGLRDALNSPNPECSLCRGEGVRSMIITDSRRLSGPARRLYAGAQQTKDGIKVLFRDQDKALDNLSRYLGMIVEKRELSAPGGAPLAPVTLNVREMTDAQLDALLAAQMAQKTIDGGNIGGTLALPASNPSSISELEAASSP